MILIKDMHGNVWDVTNKPGLEKWLAKSPGSEYVNSVDQHDPTSVDEELVATYEFYDDEAEAED